MQVPTAKGLPGATYERCFDRMGLAGEPFYANIEEKYLSFVSNMYSFLNVRF